MTIKQLGYGCVAAAGLCALLMTAPLGAVAQQVSRFVVVDDFDTLLTSSAAIESAVESSQASLDAIESGLSADAVHDNGAIASGPQLMAVGKSTAPTAVGDESDAVRIWADLTGRLQINTSHINGVAPLMGNGATGTGAMRVSIANDSTGVVRLTDGTNSNVLDPCQTVAKTTTAFSQTSIANIISADAAKVNYICAIVIVASAAEAVSVVEDDTSGCGSLTAALMGSTTAANGLSLPANGGLTLGNGQSTVIAGSAANRYLCLSQDGSDRISGSITWVQR